MSNFTPALFLTPTGDPLLGRPPPRLHVLGGFEPTQDQMAQAEHAYLQFCDQVRLSPAKHHIQELDLDDGSWLRLVSSYGVDEIVMRPAPQQIGRAFGIGYTVFADVAFAPVYERPIVDFSSAAPPPYPDPPEFELEFPELQYAPRPAFAFYRTVHQTNPSVPGIHVVLREEVRSVLLLGNSVVMEVSGTLVEELEVYDAGVGHVRRKDYTDYPANVAWTLAPGSPTDPSPGDPVQHIGGPATPFPHSAVPPYADGIGLSGLGRGIVITSVNPSVNPTSFPWIVGPDKPLPDELRGCSVDDSLRSAWYALNAEADVLQSAYNDAYDAAVIEWHEAQQDFIDGPLKAWGEACAAIDAAYPPLGPYTAIYAQRAAERVAQIAALHAWLDTGMAHPHLAASLSRFPWNIGTRPKDALLQLGTVTADGPTSAGEEDRYLEFTATGADRLAEVPDPINDAEPPDVAHFGHDAPHPLGRDFAWGPCLFGWLASGTWRRYAAWRHNHQSELPEIAPHDLSTLAFSMRDGYREWLEGDIELVEAKDVTIASDGYVPEGTSLKIVQLEYECFDRFSGVWLWTACPQMLTLDAVWIKHIGRYTVPPLIDPPIGSTTARRVRSRRVLLTKRAEDGTWSEPEAVPPDELGPPMDLAIPLLVNAAAPYAVVYATNLAVTAVPIEDGSTVFPNSATFLLAGDDDAVREASTVEPGQSIDQRHIIAAAMRTLGVIP